MRSEAQLLGRLWVRVNRRAKLPRAKRITRFGSILGTVSFSELCGRSGHQPSPKQYPGGLLASLFMRLSLRAAGEFYDLRVSAAWRIPLMRRPPAIGAFEFVVLSALRAAQLMRGCIPKVEGAHKLTTTAQWEVASGKIVNIYDASLAPRSLVAATDPEPALVSV